ISLDLRLTKRYFKLLQAIHHSEILEARTTTNPYPQGMLKQVLKLTSFIKPSSPNQSTLDKVKLNTTEWMDRNMQILREHYDGVIATILSEIDVFDVDVFNRAVTWGRGRYKRRFTDTSVQTLRSMLRQIPKKPLASPLESFDCRESFPLLPESARCFGEELGSETHGKDGNGEDERGDLLISQQPSPKERREKRDSKRRSEQIVEITKIAKPNTYMQIVLEQPHVDPPTLSILPKISRGGSDQINRELYSDIVGGDAEGISRLSPVVESAPEVDTENALNISQVSGKSGVEMMMGEPTKGEINSQRDPESESPTEIGWNNNGEEHSLSARLEPTKHPRTVRKIFDWEIEIVKPILIIGDSNLARIPQFRDIRVQVDSFPGATFYHIKGVLEKLGTLPAVEKVVLSVGLNNCLGRQTSTTTWKQLQQLLKVCEKRFPNAQVYVPVLNYSDRLDRQVQILIQNLNRTIVQRCQFLPDLNRLGFYTEARDPVHWRSDTAVSIFKFWLDQLNM
ncbi:MAG: hypothetical protein ACRCX7_10470, partial [Cetobacterium sp.]|uniref:hypothetical protein n=1 Tax=Cetobacterium sp. TaxID=2071632 RepID=UPI003F2B97D0